MLLNGKLAQLSLIDRLEGATSFDELHNVVTAGLSRIDGIGALTEYDIATRTGAFLRLAPTSASLRHLRSPGRRGDADSSRRAISCTASTVDTTLQSWGLKVGFVVDPSGVLWHVAEAPF